jgi:hypothetical protein
VKCLFDGAVEDRQSQINMHCLQRFRPIALKRTFNRRLGCSQEKISCLDAVLSQGRTSSRSSTTAAPEAKKNKRPALSIPPGRAESSQPTFRSREKLPSPSHSQTQSAVETTGLNDIISPPRMSEFSPAGRESRRRRDPGNSGRARARSLASDGRPRRSRHRSDLKHRAGSW